MRVGFRVRFRSQRRRRKRAARLHEGGGGDNAKDRAGVGWAVVRSQQRRAR